MNKEWHLYAYVPSFKNKKIRLFILFITFVGWAKFQTKKNISPQVHSETCRGKNIWNCKIVNKKNSKMYSPPVIALPASGSLFYCPFFLLCGVFLFLFCQLSAKSKDLRYFGCFSGRIYPFYCQNKNFQARTDPFYWQFPLLCGTESRTVRADYFPSRSDISEHWVGRR